MMRCACLPVICFLLLVISSRTARPADEDPVQDSVADSTPSPAAKVAPSTSVERAFYSVSKPGVAEAQTAPAKGEQQIGVENVPDGFEDAYSHLHVTPSTHRRILFDEVGVTLKVTFSLHPAVQTIRLTLPVGYELLEHTEGTPAEDCPEVFSPSSTAEMSAYANVTEAQPLIKYILSCQMMRGGDVTKGNNDDQAGQNDSGEVSVNSDTQADKQLVLQRAQIEMRIAAGIPGLSKKTKEFKKTEWSEDKALKWWYFHLQVKYPDIDPSPDRNSFQMHWSSTTSEDWEGETDFHAWPILGDWECRYSDWEGWESCTAQCGGGNRVLTRRVLSQPPSGIECKDTVHPNPEQLPCNQHPCLDKCDIDKWSPWTACTASCGGGVKFKRKKCVGEKCPAADDPFAEVVEECNTQPCKLRCTRADTWTAVTECDALCGFGTFLAMRKVLQKDVTDHTCEPIYERVTCMGQLCTKFTVVRPDANDLPYPGEKFKVALTWQQSSQARLISIRAPFGYSFGKHDEPCEFVKGTDNPIHNLLPHLEECKVDMEESLIKLLMYEDNPLPPSGQGYSQDEIFADSARYELHVVVTNPHCEKDSWDADPITSTRTCIPHSKKSGLTTNEDRNRWQIEIFQTGNTVEAEQDSAQGYRLYWKPGLKDPVPDMEKTNLRLVEEADLPPQLPENRKEAAPEQPKARQHRDDDAGGNYEGLPFRHLCRSDWDCEDVAPKLGLSCDWDKMCRNYQRGVE
eukprot:TRINITY_DN72602_c0_g1_i1.p1 TRINITY_DN72602_c0_g1~~TRINITY_DN72602_c0_g1_i1.p1  ORF type:complete len:741 (-),score=124.73 TRINITY_DN72602_c0_g1_i1:13-2235(-)